MRDRCGVRRLGGHEQRVIGGEALGHLEQGSAFRGDERSCMLGRRRRKRSVGPAGEPGELQRGGGGVAQPAERVQRANGGAVTLTVALRLRGPQLRAASWSQCG